MKIQGIITNLLFIGFCGLLLALSLRGLPGNPNPQELNTKFWKQNGPFELSPERGRFALTYSLIEDKSFHFSVPIARFATPDLGYQNGNYVSLFAPGVSFIAAPGYLLGKALGASQAGAFATIGLFAIANCLLVKKISEQLGFGTAIGMIAGLLFLFATPAFNYATILYQHHISTFIILSCLYLFITYSSFWILVPISFLIACSIPIDYPNLFLIIPIGVATLGRVIMRTKTARVTEVVIHPLRFLCYLGLIFPLIFFLWFNLRSYNNPLQLSGTVRSVQQIDLNGKPTDSLLKNPQDPEQQFNTEREDKAISFFNTRNALNGLYILIASPDRGILVYASVIVLGVIGFAFLTVSMPQTAILLIGVTSINLILYALWGDPWGGWAFGSRYLIPSYALLAVGVGALLNRIRHRLLILIFIIMVSTYSIFVNTAGALTSSANPPQVEILALEKLSGQEQKYTFQRNLDFLMAGESKSFVFETVAQKHLFAWTYFLIITATITTVTSILVISLWFQKSKNQSRKL